MKAIRVSQFGGPDVLVVADVPTPEPGPGQVRVKVEAAGVNPVETYIRSGAYARLPALPFTPGTDGAGVVDAIGDGVTTVSVGDRVYLTTILGRASTGTYAEYVCCDAACVHPLPATMTAGQGAAVGVPYATAWRALFQKAHLVPGDTVFVHGASGGVGLAAVQIARAHGARVIGTAGTVEGLELIRSEGAHVALNHATEQYLDELTRVTGGNGPDVILEMLANVNLERDFTVAARHARIVIIGNRGTIQITPRLIMAKELTVVGLTYWNTPAEDDAQVQAGLAAGLEAGTLRPAVGRQFALAEAPRAHDAVLERGAHGKIVLLPVSTPLERDTARTFWRLAIGVLIAYVLVLALPIPLFDPDEGLHAAMAREMVERGDWITPRLLGVAFFDKPILYFWALATSLWALGMHEFAVRLPGIAFGLAGVAATASFGATLAGRRAGAISGLVHATMLLPFAVSAVAVHDIALVPFTTLAMLGLWRAAGSKTAASTMGWGAAAGIVLGAAVLTKALSGVAAVGLPFAVWMLWDRRLRVSLLVAGLACVAVAALVSLPWYMAMEGANPGYLRYYFVQRHLLGFTTTTQLHGSRAWWYYVPIMVTGAMPWTGFLWPAARDSAPDTRSARRLLWTWLVVGLVFFSAAGSKLATYVLPLFPAIALLVGTACDRRWDLDDPDDHAVRAADSLGGAALALVLPVLVGVSILRFGLTPEPLFGTFVVLAGVFLAGLWIRGSRTRTRDRVTRMLVASSVVMPLAVLVAMAPAAPAFSARAVARYYNEKRELPRALWFVNERVGSFLFYLDRDLRDSLAPDTVELATLDRLLSMRQSPAGLVIAIPVEQLPIVERRVSLAGVPNTVAGHHRLYDGADFVEALRRAHLSPQ